MSTITNLNDGVGTYVHGDPVFGVFETALKKSDDTAAGLHVLSHLRKCEQNVGSVFHGPDNHAGQILAFHPGEQVHRGMGYDGRVDPLTPGLRMRIVLFLCFVPKRYFNHVWSLKLFSSEYAWGFMRKGVTLPGITEQVFFSKK